MIFFRAFLNVGPFADCHFVDPTPFYESCLYDLCLMEPGEGGECDTAYQYAAACQQEGGQPGDWRTWADCRKCPEFCYFWTNCVSYRKNLFLQPRILILMLFFQMFFFFLTS